MPFQLTVDDCCLNVAQWISLTMPTRPHTSHNLLRDHLMPLINAFCEVMCAFKLVLTPVLCCYLGLATIALLDNVTLLKPTIHSLTDLFVALLVERGTSTVKVQVLTVATD